MCAATSTNEKLKCARYFKEKLDNLECPLTDSVDESWISELIFRPGEARIQLLNWLFSKFDSRLADVLDPQLASTDTKMDSRIQRLLVVASTMGLCRPDDADLVRGFASVSKQTAFMKQLVEIVCVAEAAEDPRHRTLQPQESLKVNESMHLDEQVSRDCLLMDQITSQVKRDSLFTSRAKLLPPDIMHQIKLRWAEDGHANPENQPVPNMTHLVEQAVNTAEELSKQNSHLADLRDKIQYQDCDVQELSKVNKTMQLVLTELSQLIVGFSYCYENEMKQWCNRTPPVLNELGQIFKRVHSLLQQFTALLEGISEVKKGYLSICTATKEASLSGSVSQSTMESFQSCIDILEESSCHQGSRDNTLSSVNSSMVKL